MAEQKDKSKKMTGWIVRCSSCDRSVKCPDWFIKEENGFTYACGSPHCSECLSVAIVEYIEEGVYILI